MDDWGCRSSLDRHLRQRVRARIAKSSRLCSCRVYSGLGSDDGQTWRVRFCRGQPRKFWGRRRRMTPITLAVLAVAIVVLIFLSALFSGLETALFSLKPHQLRRLEANHPAFKKFIEIFPSNPPLVLNVPLLGCTAGNVT